jgi:hypothetical protein
MDRRLLGRVLERLLRDIEAAYLCTNPEARVVVAHYLLEAGAAGLCDLLSPMQAWNCVTAIEAVLTNAWELGDEGWKPSKQTCKIRARLQVQNGRTTSLPSTRRGEV